MNCRKEKLTFSCLSCNGSYKSKQGLKQHYARSSFEAPTYQCQVTLEHQSTQNNVNENMDKWCIIPGEDNIKFENEQIVYWKKNLFLLLTGKTGKLFIDELTKLFNDELLN